MKRIYLDYAAATPVDPRVLQSMMPYFSEKFHNPSALYEESRNVKADLENARHQTAQLIGAKPSEIIFTAGGTESANLAVHGVMQSFPDGNMLFSAIEHEAVAKPAENYHHSVIPVDKYGIVDYEYILKKSNDSTVLVSVMIANNEIGTVQPIKLISEVIQKIRQTRRINGIKKPIYLHIDACQAPLYLDINVSKLGIDLMTLNGGKIHGPKQSGILYVKAGVVIKPIISGGGQEWGYRSGTENVAFAVGFTKALELAEKGRSSRAKKIAELRDYFIKELEIKFSAEISGHRKHRLANNINTLFPGIDNERVVFALDDMGVSVSTGSACSASSEEASHVLLAIGKTEQEARSSIRFSLGKTSNKQIIDKTLKILTTALKA